MDERSSPEGYNPDVWRNIICKTPFSGLLVGWIAQLLAESGQDPVSICNALAVEYEASEHAAGTKNDESTYQEILCLWQGKEMRYLSELVYDLSKLKRPPLDPRIIVDRASELCNQDGKLVFVEEDRQEVPSQALQSQDSGLCLSQEVYPAACTEALMEPFFIAVEEEEAALNNLTNMRLVTGADSAKGPPISAYPLPGSDDDKRRVKRLREELRSLQRKFCSLLHHVYKMFKEKDVKIDNLRLYLTQRCADERDEVPLFPKIVLDTFLKADLHKAFLLLSHVGAWYFLNYVYIEDILEEFEISDQETIRRLGAYREAVNTFKNETNLLDFLAVWGGRCDNDRDFPGYRSVIAKSIDDPKSFTIADACEKASFIAGQFSLKNLSFRLANGRQGSVYIRWLLPAPVTKYMLKVMESKQKPDLLKLRIVQLTVERKVFKSEASYENLHKLSVASPRWFWGVAAKDLTWRECSKEVFTHNKQTGEFHWFRDAELNVSENCLDVHVKECPEKVALIWERDDSENVKVTYRELLDQTCQVANVLKERGVRKGDVVVICMPTMPLAVASMLACARIGAVHCVLFPDFSADVLNKRIEQVKAKAVITADARVIGGETKDLKGKVVEAIKKGNTLVDFVLVAKRSDTHADSAEEGEDTQEAAKLCFSLEKEMEGVSTVCEPESMAGEDTLFIAYTSGTQTGTSKAVYHTQAGYLLYTKVTFKFMFNPDSEAIIGCVSDLAWLAAHSYVVYGPLSNGNTTLLFESVANHPNEGRYWRMVDKLKVTHFYTVPSVLKELMIKDKELKEECQLDSLKVIASGGEPIPVDIQRWYYEMIGKKKCLFLDTWGQTELGGTGIVRWEAPEGKERIDFPKSKSFALFGIDLGKLEQGNSELFLKQPLPGMGKHVRIVDDQRGYCTGDILECTDPKTQLFRVTERKEKALLIQGVWFSIAAIEDSLRVMYSGICDAQVITYQDSYNKPESVFVVLQTGEEYKEDLKDIAAFYTLAKVRQNLVKAGLEVKVFFLKCVKQLNNCFETAGKKRSNSLLREYLKPFVSSASNERSWQEIDAVKLSDFCRLSPLCV